jgi:hypothetical protein
MADSRGPQAPRSFAAVLALNLSQRRCLMVIIELGFSGSPHYILSKVRFGKELGGNIIPQPPPGDKLLSNKQLILGQLNVLNATAPSKKFSTASFLRYGPLTGSTPYTGGKIVVK